MSASFFDILNDFINIPKEASQKFDDEIKDLDITTDEGYGKYMKFLGDIRVRSEKYNDFMKLVLGEDVSDLIDRMAKEATDQYTEAKKEREEAERVAEEKRKAEEIRKKKEEMLRRNVELVKEKEAEAKKSKFDISKDHGKIVLGTMPSDKVSDEVHQSICNVVSRYMETYIDPYVNDYDDRSEIEAELIEFACWLKSQN